MNKIEVFEQEKIKNKIMLNNISNCLKNINYKIDDLEKNNRKQENIINKFEIKCFKYDLVDELINLKKEFANGIQNIIKETKKINLKNGYELNKEQLEELININEILKKYETQLKSLEKEDFSIIEKLQMNAIKKGIYDKFVLNKSEIDKAKFKKKFDKIQNRNILAKAIDRFLEREENVDRKKENVFLIIKGIDQARANINEFEEPKKEYKIIEILAEIELFIKENYNSENRDNLNEIYSLRNNIYSVFSIDNKELKKEILIKQKSKATVKMNEKNSTIIREHEKIIEYLNKNGYDSNSESTDYKSYTSNLIKKVKLISKMMGINEKGEL